MQFTDIRYQVIDKITPGGKLIAISRTGHATGIERLIQVGHLNQLVPNVGCPRCSLVISNKCSSTYKNIAYP